MASRSKRDVWGRYDDDDDEDEEEDDEVEKADDAEDNDEDFFKDTEWARTNPPVKITEPVVEKSSDNANVPKENSGVRTNATTVTKEDKKPNAEPANATPSSKQISDNAAKNSGVSTTVGNTHNAADADLYSLDDEDNNQRNEGSGVQGGGRTEDQRRDRNGNGWGWNGNRGRWRGNGGQWNRRGGRWNRRGGRWRGQRWGNDEAMDRGSDELQTNPAKAVITGLDALTNCTIEIPRQVAAEIQNKMRRFW